MKGAFPILALLLGGCSLAPDYRRPTVAVPTVWPTGPQAAALQRDLPMLGHRDIFLDPRLQAILARALAANQDVAEAVANVRIARGQLGVARAQLLPQIDGGVGVSIFDRGGGGATVFPGPGGAPGENLGEVPGGSQNARTTIYSADIGVTAFELDLFGRLGSLRDAARAEFLASESAVRTARLTLVADIATVWATLAADRTLLAIAEETILNARASVDLTRARLQGGIAPRSDLRQAETVLAQAEADHADLRTLVAQDINALGRLVGGAVGEAELPGSIDELEAGFAETPVGLDSTILLRRPDILEAEFALQAANARIGAARAAFFPRIGLTGALGLASRALETLFSGGAFNYSVAADAGVPIFDGGANRGNLEIARGQYDAALARYAQAIQTGFREVADTLARRETIEAQVAAQGRLAAAAADNLFLADARYREGIDAFLTALDAQRTLYTARRTVVAGRLLRVANRIDLYRTVGADDFGEVAATARAP